MQTDHGSVSENHPVPPEARVIEAERDVVLGGQVLVARSGGGIVSARVAEGPPRVPGETPRRLAPVPPPFGISGRPWDLEKALVLLGSEASANG